MARSNSSAGTVTCSLTLFPSRDSTVLCIRTLKCIDRKTGLRCERTQRNIRILDAARPVRGGSFGPVSSGPVGSGRGGGGASRGVAVKVVAGVMLLGLVGTAAGVSLLFRNGS